MKTCCVSVALVSLKQLEKTLTFNLNSFIQKRKKNPLLQNNCLIKLLVAQLLFNLILLLK